MLPKPTDDIQRDIDTMVDAPPEKNIHDRIPEVCGEEISRVDFKIKKKAHSTKLSSPPLCQDPPLSVGLISRPRPGRATVDTNWTEGPCLIASALRTHIPFKTADESVALR